MKEVDGAAKKIDWLIFKIMWGVSTLAGVCLLAVAVICTIDALGSKIFSHSLPNGTDLVTYFNIPIVFFGIAFVQVERGHTTVDLLSGIMPKWAQKLISLCGSVVGCFVCIYLGYTNWGLWLNKYATGAKASSAGNSFPVWPFTLIISVGFILLACSFVWTFIREFAIPPAERMGALPEDEDDQHPYRPEEESELDEELESSLDWETEPKLAPEHEAKPESEPESEPESQPEPEETEGEGAKV